MSRWFVAPPHPYGAGHRGIDLRARDGQRVSAPAAGVIAFVGMVVDRPVVSIDHDDGVRSTFEPVESDLTAGTVVAAGDVFGVVSGDRSSNPHCSGSQDTGSTDTHCLHVGARCGERYLNPAILFGYLSAPVLLPAVRE